MNAIGFSCKEKSPQFTWGALPIHTTSADMQQLDCFQISGIRKSIN